MQTNSSLFMICYCNICEHMRARLMGLKYCHIITKCLYPYIYISLIDWVSICTSTGCFGYKHLIYMLYAYTHAFSLCSYSATLTLAFVNQIGITGFCQCARGWERNIKLKFWLWIVSNLNFMYQCFHNWHVVFLLILQYEWKFNHILCFDPVTE